MNEEKQYDFIDVIDAMYKYVLTALIFVFLFYNAAHVWSNVVADRNKRYIDDWYTRQFTTTVCSVVQTPAGPIEYCGH